MEWWIWVLIAVGVILIGALKLVFFKKFMQKKKAQKPKFEDD